MSQAPSSPYDLSTPQGRRQAYLEMGLNDHGVLRLFWTNAAWISDEMVRTNQPWPHQIRAWSRKGIKTVINLRGGIHTGFHQLEREACEQAGIALMNFTVESRGAPTRDQIWGAKALFETIAYPALMHCKSGADRVGLMSTLYLHLRKGEPVERARRMLGLRFGHVKQGKTGVLDFFFDQYQEHGVAKGLSLLEWVDRDYDPMALKRRFLSQWWANILVDRILRRE